MVRDAERCDVVGPHEVRYVFKTGDNRDLPLVDRRIAGPLQGLLLQSRFHQDRRSSRPWGPAPTRSAISSRPSMLPIRGATIIGARICRSIAGATISMRSAYEYFRDRNAGFEALKGGVLDLREEFTSREWATAYDFAAVAGRPRASRPNFRTKHRPARKASSSI